MINWATIIVSVISFLLGIFGSLFLQWRADRTRLNRIKGALELHLKRIILKDCEILLLEYEMIIVAIQKRNLYSISFKVFETFDCEIYKANNPSDYYKIYALSEIDKFETLVSIYAIISFLKENLPYKLHSEYMSEINLHIDRGLKTGETRIHHFESCAGCDVIRNNYITTGKMRLNEISELKKLITKLLHR